MRKTLAAHVLHPVWRIERAWLRRPLAILGVALIIALRLAGIALIPLTCILWFVLSVLSALREMATDFPGLFAGTMRGEVAAWGELPRGLRLVWSTSYANRFIPKIIRRADGES